jgi:hypothetical protein
VEELESGETVVLTLADQRILDERGNTLADGDDELINVGKVRWYSRMK